MPSFGSVKDNQQPGVAKRSHKDDNGEHHQQNDRLGSPKPLFAQGDMK